MRRRSLLVNLLNNPLILLLSLILGSLLAWRFPGVKDYTNFLTGLYFRVILLVTTPFIFISLLSGSVNSHQHKQLKSNTLTLVKWFFILFIGFFTVGTLMVLAIKPLIGSNIPKVLGSLESVTLQTITESFFNRLIPDNISGILLNFLSLSISAILIGVAITLLKKDTTKDVIVALDVIYQIFYKLTYWVFLSLPVGLLLISSSIFHIGMVDSFIINMKFLLPLFVLTIIILLLNSLYLWRKSNQVYKVVLKEYFRGIHFSLFTPNSALLIPLNSTLLIHKLKFERDTADFTIPVTLIFYRMGTVLSSAYIGLAVIQYSGISIGIEVVLGLFIWTLLISILSIGLSEVIVISFIALILRQIGVINDVLLLYILSLDLLIQPVRVLINNSVSQFLCGVISKPKAFVEEDFVHGVLLQNLPENVNLRRYFSDFSGELPVIDIEVTDFILTVFPNAVIKEYKDWDEIKELWVSYEINIVIGDREYLRDVVEVNSLESKLVALNRRHQ